MSTNLKIKAQLEQRLGGLVRGLKEIDQILRQPEDKDLQEMASEWDDDDVLQRLARLHRQEIALIREALKRIDCGDYGTCRECGKRIALRRLVVLPQATTCVRCAEAAV